MVEHLSGKQTSGPSITLCYMSPQALDISTYRSIVEDLHYTRIVESMPAVVIVDLILLLGLGARATNQSSESVHDDYKVQTLLEVAYVNAQTGNRTRSVCLLSRSSTTELPVISPSWLNNTLIWSHIEKL